MRILKRFLSSIAAVVLIGCLFFLFDSAGVFFNEISEGIADYNVITESQLKNKLPVQGTVYTVYDCIAVAYDSDSGDDEEFYYLIEFDEDKDLYMILETKAGSEIDDDIDALCDAYIFGDNDTLLESGVSVDGVLVENDSGVVGKFNEWKEDMLDYGEDSSSYSLVPYTLDCSYTVSSFHNEFIGSAAVLAIALIIMIAGIVLTVKGRKRNRIAANAGGAYIPQQSFGQPNNFGVQNPYNQQPNMYNQNNQYGQNNYYPQNIPQPNIPQAVNLSMNPNSQDPSNSTFIPTNSFKDSSVQDYNNQPSTVYAEEQKVSLDKKDY